MPARHLVLWTASTLLLTAQTASAQPRDARPSPTGAMALQPFAAAAARCVRVGDDDNPAPYSPSFRAAFMKAFANGGDVLNDATLKTGVVRCMDHRLYGCLIGANQPCYKMDVARENTGAEAFCRENPDASSVPLAASGHGSIYDYACVAGHAKITRTDYEVDARGFARRLWRPLN